MLIKVMITKNQSQVYFQQGEILLWRGLVACESKF